MRSEGLRDWIGRLQLEATRLLADANTTSCRRQLTCVLLDLDEVESFVLPRAANAQTQLGKTAWLEAAETRVRLAASVVTSVQDAMDDDGFDAQEGSVDEAEAITSGCVPSRRH